MKHVAVYLRVSTEGVKGNHTQSTEMQRLEITNYLQAKGITEFTVYEDKGISGTKKDRPALNKMMQECRKGNISMVVCWRLDRLFRSLKDLIDTLATFQELKVEFVALKDGIDLSNATGRLMMQILGAFGEFEAAVIKERIMSGLANAKAKGIKLGRPFKNGHSVIANLKKQGKTNSEIAEQTGLSVQTVGRALNKLNAGV